MTTSGISAALGALWLSLACGNASSSHVDVDPGEPAQNPQAWFRADQGVEASNAAVSRWADVSGHGHDGVMGSEPRQPSLIAGALHKLPVVRFSGAQSLYFEAPLSANTFSVFVVGKNSSPNELHSVFLGPGGETPNHQLRWENHTTVLIVGLEAGIPITSMTFGDTQSYHVLAVRYDGSDLQLYRNGAQVGSASFRAYAPWVLGQLGAWFSSDFMRGDLAEVLFYDRSLSDEEVSASHTYLSEKYDIR